MRRCRVLLATVSLATALSLCGGLPFSPLLAQQPFDYMAPDASIEYDLDTGAGSGVFEVLVAEDPANAGYPNNTQGFSMALESDPALLFVADVEEAQVLADLNNGSGPDFFSPNIEPDGWGLGVVYDFVNAEFIQFEQPTPTVIVTYQSAVVAPDGDEFMAELSWSNTAIGNPPVTNVMVVDGSAIGVNFINGQILIVPEFVPPDLFRRGDADGNGTVTGLVDGLFILSYQFIPGSPAPPCFDAADADDSGSVSGLVDGFFILNYQFVPGSPPPPLPGPSTCDADPTVDDLECEISPCP